MPPKKNVDISGPVKRTKEKVLRKKTPREKPAEKPKLKTPMVLKMKLPSIKSFLIPTEDQSMGPSNDKNKGNVSPQLSPRARRKIELANEVALAQLVKPTTEVKKPEFKSPVKYVINKIVIPPEEDVKKKLGRGRPPKAVKAETTEKAKVVKKKVLDPQEAVTTGTEGKKRVRKKNDTPFVEPPVKRSLDTTTNSTKESAEVPKKKRAYVRKTPLNRTKKTESVGQEAQACETSKRKADSTSTGAPPRAVKRKYVRKKLIKNDETITQPEAQSTSEKQVKKKGKKNLIDTISTNDQSPSILNGASKITKNMDRSEPQNTESKISNPCTVESRQTSISECLSWTKDISSSSTTTCLSVGSNDFFRIDKKVPIIKLSHVENEWTNISDIKNRSDDSDTDSSSSGDSSSGDSSSGDSSSSSSSSSASSKGESSRHSITQSLNLSTPSISTSKSNVTGANSTQSNTTKDDDWQYILQKLSANLKKLDVEAINWIGYQNQTINTTIDIVEHKIFKLLKFENDVLKDCENIRKIFRANNSAEDNGKTVNKNDENEKVVERNDEPNSYTSRSEDDENFTTSKGKYVMFDQNCATEEDPLQVSQICCNRSSEEDAFSPDKINYAPYYDQDYNNDDDDALSLFAESITGIESSRINSSANSICANASEFEEYIPQPVPSSQLFSSTTYVPTKILDNEYTQNHKSNTVCEKQNADSTSIYKETENKSQNNTQKYPEKTHSPVIANVPKTSTTNKMLLHHLYKPVQGVKSVVFRGVCFYNLISNCKKIRCIFPHEKPNNIDIRGRLANLSEDVFIQEYLLVRNWPTLRRWYGICYVSECIERKLTRFLLEMTIDFISKTRNNSEEDAAMTISVIERTLLYLNSIDLHECDDLLHYDFAHNIILCDILMTTIAETQNFSRFKAVFIKLTSFITGIGRKFQLSVANHILERVCILPCEEPLAFAVLAIIKNTDPEIFDNSMMSQFEKQLSSLDLTLYGKLCRIREQADLQRTQASNEGIHSPRISQEVERLGLMHTEREERYTSPDTTKMDNLNKLPDESMQTVKNIRPLIFDHIFKIANSSPPVDNVEDKRPFRSWRDNMHNRSYPNIHQNTQGNRFSRPMQRPLTRPHLKRNVDQRNVVFGSMPPKFPRRSGPNF